MKHLFFLSLFISNSMFSQPLAYTIKTNAHKGVTKEALSHASTLNDIVDSYPSSWITDYLSVEVTATSSGKTKTLKGTNNILSEAQKSLLASADAQTDVIIHVNYKKSEEFAKKEDVRTIHVELSIVPFKETSFPGGPQAMKKYFQLAGIEKLAKTLSEKEDTLSIRFHVDKTGKISSVRMKNTSSDPSNDATFLRSIENMPTWMPAENKNGENVERDLEFAVVPNSGC